MLEYSNNLLVHSQTFGKESTKLAIILLEYSKNLLVHGRTFDNQQHLCLG